MTSLEECHSSHRTSVNKWHPSISYIRKNDIGQKWHNAKLYPSKMTSAKKWHPSKTYVYQKGHPSKMTSVI